MSGGCSGSTRPLIETRIIQTDCSAGLDLRRLQPGEKYPRIREGEDRRDWGEGQRAAYNPLFANAWVMWHALNDCREAAGE